MAQFNTRGPEVLLNKRCAISVAETLLVCYHVPVKPLPKRITTCNINVFYEALN